MQYTVNRGDSLWRLAVRFQGSGTQWPKLVEYHNNYVARQGPHNWLQPIANENLIFIGQTLFLPPRPKHTEMGPGKKRAADTLAKTVDLAINFGIGRDTPPCVWSRQFPQTEIKAELSGTITIEMASDDRHRHNLEIALSKNSVEVKEKLKKLYNPVLGKLLAEPSVRFEGGEVKLNSPIAAQANLGPYTIEVKPGVTPMQMSGSIKPPKVSATMKNDGCDYKYSAEITYKVDVTRRPENQPVQEPVSEMDTEKSMQKKIAQYPTSSIDWSKLALDADEILTAITITILSYIPQVRFSTIGIRAIMPSMYYNHSVRPGYYEYPSST